MVFCYRNFMKLISSLISSVSHTMIPDSDRIPFKTTSNSIHCPQRQLSCSCHEMQCTLVGMHACARAHVWVCVPSCFSCVWLLQPHGLRPTRILCPWDSPGKITGVGCHAFFQEIFLTQVLNPHLLGLPHWQAGSLPLALINSKTLCDIPKQLTPDQTKI